VKGPSPGAPVPGWTAPGQQIQDAWVLYPIPGVTSLSSLRTLLFFWLISLVGLLWATFLLAEGVWFWVSVWLVLAIVGSNFLVLLLRFR